jgi:predicted SAM-dependent methyltransferase
MNRQIVMDFAKRAKTDFFLTSPGGECSYRREHFDLILLSHVLEHLHDSPYELLCRLMDWLNPDGLLLVVVPNAANVRKRLELLCGVSNYPSYEEDFCYAAPWGAMSVNM